MKKILSLVSAILFLLPTALALASCSDPDRPVYDGMTVRQTSPRARSAGTDALKIDFCSADGPDQTNSTEAPSDTTVPETDGHKAPSQNLENDIDEIIDIDVVDDNEIQYYVSSGQTFIIEVHISNPKSFEIQSFTLNGKKYADYMFEKGSTVDCLLLEVTAPVDFGYVEYTIDAIKYIDGTKIKDVDMSSANRTVKVGLAYPEKPSAQLFAEPSVTPTSIDLNINVADHPAITNSNLSAYLSDGEKIVDSKPVTVGQNNVTFSNLDLLTRYEYGVCLNADIIDGQGATAHWLLKGELTTLSAFKTTITKTKSTSVSFVVMQFYGNASITSILLYDANTGKLVKRCSPETREITGLAPSTQYRLYIEYTYTVNGETKSAWDVIKGIQTDGTYNDVIYNIVPSDTTIVGEFAFENPDLVTSVTSVDLYKVDVDHADSDILLQTNTEGKIHFEGLEPLTPYRLVFNYIGYVDGQYEPVALSFESWRYIQTAPIIKIKRLFVTDVSADSICLQMELGNIRPYSYGDGDPLKYYFKDDQNCRISAWSGVCVNGEYYQLDNSNPNEASLSVTIPVSKLGSGEVTLTVEEIAFTAYQIYESEYSDSTSTPKGTTSLTVNISQ